MVGEVKSIQFLTFTFSTKLSLYSDLYWWCHNGLQGCYQLSSAACLNHNVEFIIHLRVCAIFPVDVLNASIKGAFSSHDLWPPSRDSNCDEVAVHTHCTVHCIYCIYSSVYLISTWLVLVRACLVFLVCWLHKHRQWNTSCTGKQFWIYPSSTLTVHEIQYRIFSLLGAFCL